jgi:hypothetical protein
VALPLGVGLPVAVPLRAVALGLLLLHPLLLGLPVAQRLTLLQALPLPLLLPLPLPLLLALFPALVLAAPDTVDLPDSVALLLPLLLPPTAVPVAV